MGKKVEDVDKRVEWLHHEKYSASYDVFGEPQKTARIGDEYQAQIPSLLTENERLQLIALPVCHDFKTDVQNPFEFGLSIPVSWVQNQHKKLKKSVKSAEGKSGVLGSRKRNYMLPIPCTSNETWSKNEHDSFLLGLYIFGKNLHAVSKFVGNKGMSNVVSYYYGTFYRSKEHKKWSIYWKKRIRKYLIPGKKIFKGWRLQELLSRLLPNVSDKCKTRLTQVRMFEEGKQTFENYVFALRDIVGINLLVESVAVGIEKRDLTSKIRRRVTTKKLCGTKHLKTEELVSILKGQMGLSKEGLTKAGLNDLFWEAVWPRLLARGWHSEQLMNNTFENSRNCLVFLAPGVAKFSRRDLVKGSQYFDSFTEVLNKVTFEPELLEQEPNQDGVVEPQANQSSCEGVVEPRAKQSSCGNQDFIKCTIVDTSLAGLVKVRKLTNLPDYKHVDIQASCSVSGNTEYNSTEGSPNEGVKHNTAETHGVVDSFDSEMVKHLDPLVSRTDNEKKDLSNNSQPIRKLKVRLKPQAKRHRVSNIRDDNPSDEDEAMEDPCSKKKRQGLVIDLNNPRVPLVSDVDNSSPSTEPLDFSETTTNQAKLLSPGANGQRQGTRNRPLTLKALEALANGFLNPKKRKSSEDRTPRRIRGKLVLNCDPNYIENRVDGVS
uniref:uncharacterized protein LOC122581982 n=1 Tax=Erigeron canadensis TaxID=72917 RepID=UPI001CB999DF|nr:uncharacterized protein LOC122581982 [Erigeron canadensis]